MNAFDEHIMGVIPTGLSTARIGKLQVNVGRLCNLACKHCHLECSPARTEMMGDGIMAAVVDAAAKAEWDVVDVTGGTPELHPQFQEFIDALAKTGRPVMVRSNLVAMLAPECDGIMEFLRDRGVALVASMPCYLEENVRAQRGPGVYEQSIDAIRRLNRLGYGQAEGLPLDLVYNPGDAFLPGEQAELEEAYRRELGNRFGIQFSRLLTITNMPIGRFGERLQREGQLQAYVAELQAAFNEATLDGLMCRGQVCVDWDGRLYDCDFNLALGLPAEVDGLTIANVNGQLRRPRKIVTGNHCFGCTAGAGSSCAGALVDG